MDKDSSLIINHSGAENIDLSYLQLLSSAIKTAEAQKKTISIMESDSEKFKSLIDDSGFNNLKLFSNCFIGK